MLSPAPRKSFHVLSSLYTKGTEAGSTLDILTFEDDRLQRLDSYQRIEGFTGETAQVSSTGGEKIFFIHSAPEGKRYEWTEITSFASLGKRMCEIEDEHPDFPVMTGHGKTTAGGSCEITLSPMVCKVTLNSLGCDFSETSYSESQICDVKAYLTNVNASYPLIDTEGVKSARIINQGVLNPYDLKGFRHPEVIYTPIAAKIGQEAITPCRTFFCYPNLLEQESAGSPRTRLVIEGKIDSVTYYWPINIGENASGIRRGCNYIYDLLIKRKGVTDPDMAAEPRHLDININIKAWKDKEEYNVPF